MVVSSTCSTGIVELFLLYYSGKWAVKEQKCNCLIFFAIMYCEMGHVYCNKENVSSCSRSTPTLAHSILPLSTSPTSAPLSPPTLVWAYVSTRIEFASKKYYYEMIDSQWKKVETHLSSLVRHWIPVRHKWVDDAPLLSDIVVVRVGHRDGEVVAVRVVIVVVANGHDSSQIPRGSHRHSG